KEVGEKPEKLLFIGQVFEYLKKRGFSRYAGFIPTLPGDYFLQEDERFYIVSPWLEGEEPDYRNKLQMRATARILAQFHNATAGFLPSGLAQAKIKMDKWPRKLKKQLIEMVDFCSRAENTRNPDPFESLIKEYSGWLGQQSLMACQLLGDSAYQEVLAEYAGEIPVCHGDPASRNFLFGPEGKAWMIDFDSMAVDLPLVDMWRLLRRTMRKNAWDFSVGLNLLEGYLEVRPMTREELQVLFALLHFPERAWRLTRRYYEVDPDGPQQEEVRAELRERVEEYLAPWQEKNRFMKDFAHYFAL
ncbi:MAG TPA: CotS family spore coat protein, partial [Bacillota bacterium]|nr:CotS family spore coat protein [Bacillota bacterium]